MGKLAREVQEIVSVLGGAADHNVCVSSGTSEMRASWFLLTALGVLPATLLQVGSPADPLFGAANVKEVRIDPDSWSSLEDLAMPMSYFEASNRRFSALRKALGRLARSGTEAEQQTARETQWVGATAKCPDQGTRSEKEEVERAHVPITSPQEITIAGTTYQCDFFDPPTDLDSSSDLAEALEEIGLIVTSASLHFAVERAAIAAPAPVPVLILGETGTGKELLARLVHRLSDRRGKPMVAVNCAAIPKDLAESHLFGHTKGAFTGANAASKGVFGSADGGTVFLDEVGELPFDIQAKLLRVLEQGTLTRLGTAEEIKVDVRVVAATNRDLDTEVKGKAFS
jgi:transcriptional regulator with AAA-type ATPase domain